jgi:hypothetical protein
MYSLNIKIELTGYVLGIVAVIILAIIDYKTLAYAVVGIMIIALFVQFALPMIPSPFNIISLLIALLLLWFIGDAVIKSF